MAKGNHPKMTATCPPLAAGAGMTERKCVALFQVSAILCNLPRCMEYLPTFTLQMAQLLVNIPYMEQMGTIAIEHLHLE